MFDASAKFWEAEDNNLKICSKLLSFIGTNKRDTPSIGKKSSLCVKS